MAEDIYRTLGVRSFINCAGVRTVHGGSLMLPEVSEAMLAASRAFVNIDELMGAVSRRLGELTGAEAGIVTSGCAAALCHATAAAIAGGDPEKMIRLPRTEGMVARVIMPRTARFTYDHAIRMTGATIVEVETRDDFLGAIAEPTAMVAMLGSAEATTRLKLPDMASIARERNVPILVDAAAEILECPNPYLTRGASMVAYSGGKYLRGPQAAGLLLGEKRWIDLAWMQAAPHHTFGRPMKIGKEEIMGMVAAVEAWRNTRRFDGERAQWESSLRTIAQNVGNCAGVSSRIPPPSGPTDRIPKLEIQWDAKAVPITANMVRDELMNGDPRIMLDDRGASDTSLVILPFSLQPGQPEVVGERLRSVFSAAVSAGAQLAPRSAPAVDICGAWDVTVDFKSARIAHTISIDADRPEVRGAHRTPFSTSVLRGVLAGRDVDLASLHPYEGTSLAFRFLGSATGDGCRMSGTVELGQTGQAAPGPLNMKEYGSAAWSACRRA